MTGPLVQSDMVFWFWTILGTIFAGYGGFCAVCWWYTRSGMFALSTLLAVWLFVITSSIGTLHSSQTLVNPICFVMLQRAAFVPAALTYGLMVRMGLRMSNGRLARFRWLFFVRNGHER